jgi:hypothetical protein
MEDTRTIAPEASTDCLGARVNSLDVNNLNLEDISPLGCMAQESIPSSVLPISMEMEKKCYRVRWAPDPLIEASIDRRVRQGRKQVFSTCCCILSPLEALPEQETRSAYKVNEVFHRSSLAGYRTCALIADPGGVQALCRRWGLMETTPCLAAGACRSARARKDFVEAAGSVDLLVAMDIGGTSLDALALAQVFSFQFVLALKMVRPGGALVLQLLAPLDHIMVQACLAFGSKVFKSASLLKPEASRPGNSERFFVAKGFIVPLSLPKNMTIANLEVWVERCGQQDGKHLHDMELTKDVAPPPFHFPAGWQVGTDLLCRLIVLQRQTTTAKALELCRIVVGHRPMVRRAQLLALQEACSKNLVLQQLASHYMSRYPIPTAVHGMVQSLQTLWSSGETV